MFCNLGKLSRTTQQRGCRLRMSHQPVRAALSSWTWKTSDPGSMFSIQLKNGLLPAKPPLTVLPARFADVEEILQAMPFTREDGSMGLLGQGELAATVQSRLKTHDLSTIDDPHLLAALFRDYQFLASAYLLEPCHLVKKATGKYGVARDHLPPSIAVPLDVLGKKLDGHPFLDYAFGYALNNWTLADPGAPITFKNLRMFRRFDGGPDEAGFMLIHVAIAAQSPAQVAAVQTIVHGASSDNAKMLATGLKGHLDFLTAFHDIFETMWQSSRPSVWHCGKH